MMELVSSVFQLEIPLPGNPLKAVHVYLIRGSDGNLVVDTGFNTEEGRNELYAAMKGLGFTPHDTRILITHLHSDHCGLADVLALEGYPVLAGAIDGRTILAMTRESFWERFWGMSAMMGMAKDNVSHIDHPGYKYCPKREFPVTFLSDGDVISLGDLSLKVMDIPGHTPGHIGLYEETRRLFFGGDHILDRITPNISFWGFERDILGVYFESLDRVAATDIDWLFTAHRNSIRDHRRRIEELKRHHGQRLSEILGILGDGELTVRDVASKMHWDLRVPTWEEFPPNQKWFASSEAMSHLEHLRAEGTVVLRTEDDRALLYSLAR